MNQASSKSVLASPPHDPYANQSNLTAVLVYDADESRERGLEIINSLQGDLRGKLDLTCHLWQWDKFASLQHASVAAQQATEAELIILACQGTAGLPDRVAKWLRLWSHRPRSSAATLVASVADANLFDPHWTGIRRRLTAEMQGSPTRLMLLPRLSWFERQPNASSLDTLDQLDAYGCDVPADAARDSVAA